MSGAPQERALATSQQIRVQSAIDAFAALVLAMLAWPFPLARALLPLPVNIAAVVVFWQLVQAAYGAVTVGVWGQTLGMRLGGLMLGDAEGKPVEDRATQATWGAIAGSLALVRAITPPKDGSSALAGELELFAEVHTTPS